MPENRATSPPLRFLRGGGGGAGWAETASPSDGRRRPPNIRASLRMPRLRTLVRYPASVPSIRLLTGQAGRAPLESVSQTPPMSLEYGKTGLKRKSPPGLSGLFAVTTHDQGGICAAKTEGIRQGDINLALARLVRHQVDGSLDRRVVEINGGRSHLIPDRQDRENRLDRPCCSQQMPVDDLVEDIDTDPAWLPSNRTTAPSSISSPSGVEVPCALM